MRKALQGSIRTSATRILPGTPVSIKGHVYMRPIEEIRDIYGLGSASSGLSEKGKHGQIDLFRERMQRSWPPIVLAFGAK